MPEHESTTRPGEIVEHLRHHRDGSLWARGQMIDGSETGYWEWYRLDGTLMRSGTFSAGVQVGEWTTYDQHGAPYKTTRFRAADSATK